MTNVVWVCIHKKNSTFFFFLDHNLKKSCSKIYKKGCSLPFLVVDRVCSSLSGFDKVREKEFVGSRVSVVFVSSMASMFGKCSRVPGWLGL
jgi:hypothetical protein